MSTRWWKWRPAVRQPLRSVWSPPIIVLVAMALTATGTAQQPPETPPQAPDAPVPATDLPPDEQTQQPVFR
ncbi:MAG TPA: hypothetical protein EYM36_03115, partial [Acidobacteria bacterium]|nr:hypothetical protein [Acidobacteriota bacterium]